MDFETMDWEAEAKRVKAAFGIPVTCTEGDRPHFQWRRVTLSSRDTLESDETFFKIEYRNDGFRMFTLRTRYLERPEHSLRLMLEGDGSCASFQSNSVELTDIVVEGLRDLGWLTPEAERTLRAREELERAIANRPRIEFGAIDWDVEAARVVLAFDVDVKGGGDCKFVRSTGEGTPYYYLCEANRNRENSEDKEFVMLSSGHYMSFIFYADARYYFIGDKKERRECNFLGLHEDGTIIRYSHDVSESHIAYGLFNLGWLTPAIEAVLHADFTRQKPGWKKEFKARVAGQGRNPAYDSMDWDAEATCIAAAFEVDEPCQFIYYGGKSQCEAIEKLNGETKERLSLKNGLFAKVTYARRAKTFSVSQDSPPAHQTVFLNWDGSNRPKRGKKRKLPPAHISLALAKALFFLDLLTPETEEEIGAAITAHEKLEWALEYEARMGVGIRSADDGNVNMEMTR